MILYDSFTNCLLPLLRLKPLYMLRRGMLSDFQKANIRGETIKEIQTLRNDFFPLKESGVSITTCAEQKVSPSQLLNGLETSLINDYSLVTHSKTSVKMKNSLLGNAKDLFIDENTELSPSCEIDTRSGPIFIGKNCRIGAFSIITGPAYIGSNSILDRCSFELSTTGVHSRLGGEISNCILGDFSNKHHEGFLGHSLVGDWVNLGALTTTSDLKNNYGEIKLIFEEEEFLTGRIKLGSIIGDFSKTAIGTMLNTGTIVDFGTCLFADHPRQKYYSPFFWGGPHPKKYQLERFLADSTKIMARRAQSFSANYESIIRQLHKD